MAKTWYELKVKPIQPLHIGAGQYGVLSPSMTFIPGKTMWGALTAALGNYLGKTEEEMRKDSCMTIFEVISNFYPVINGEPCFPKYKKGELHLGEYSEKEFRYLFTDTFVSTSITAEQQSAKEDSLHEIEHILPSSKDESNNSHLELHWKGILSIDLDEEMSNKNGFKLKLGDFLKKEREIVIGGERKYGFGLAKILELKPFDKEEDWNLGNGEFLMPKPEITYVHYLEYGNTSGLSAIQGEIGIWIETESNTEKELKLKTPLTVLLPGCRLTESNIGLELIRGVLRVFDHSS